MLAEYKNLSQYIAEAAKPQVAVDSVGSIVSKELVLPSFNKALLFTGINGAGKTTTLKNISMKKPEEFVVFSASGFLMEKLGLQRGDYQSLRNLPDGRKNQAFEELMLDLHGNKSAKNNVTIAIDCHVIHCKEGEVLPCPTSWMKGLLDGIVVVTTDLPSLVKRHSEDKKERDDLPHGIDINSPAAIKLLENYQRLCIETSFAIACELGIQCISINNQQGKSDLAVEEFMQLREKFI